jgi:hypothetical protein
LADPSLGTGSKLSVCSKRYQYFGADAVIASVQLGAATAAAGLNASVSATPATQTPGHEIQEEKAIANRRVGSTDLERSEFIRRGRLRTVDFLRAVTCDENAGLAEKSSAFRRTRLLALQILS